MLAGYTPTIVTAPNQPPMRRVRGKATSTPLAISATPLANTQNRGWGTQLGTMLSNASGMTKCNVPIDVMNSEKRSGRPPSSF